jgi:hypothetical protein
LVFLGQAVAKYEGVHSKGFKITNLASQLRVLGFNIDRMKIGVYGVASTAKEVLLMRTEKKLPQ